MKISSVVESAETKLQEREYAQSLQESEDADVEEV